MLLIYKLLRNIRNSKTAKYIPDGVRLLDIGCGEEAWMLKSVETKLRSGIGIDAVVSEETRGKIRTVKSRFCRKLPFKNDSFDVVTSVAFIEHLDDPQRFLKECLRVLAPGGIVIITTPLPLSRRIWEVLIRAGFGKEKGVDDHKHYFTPTELAAILHSTGFKLKKIEKFELGMNMLAVACKPRR